MDASVSTPDSQIPVIGFIGGVGCGKSSLARWLAERRCAVFIDADAVGHEVLTQPDIRDALVDKFGSEVVAEGVVDRSWLARQVFGPTDRHRQSRYDLEAIVHPRMRDQFLQTIRQARQKGDSEWILFDAAILLESGWRTLCDLVVFVDVPEHERLRRVATSRGWTASELQSREASQWPLERKREAADVVIDNSKSLEKSGQDLVDFLSASFPRIQPASAALDSP